MERFESKSKSLEKIGRVRYPLQIPILILNEFKRIN